MTRIYQNILSQIESGQSLLAILIDPDKTSNIENAVISGINNSIATHIFVGGSDVKADATELLVKELKSKTNLPVVLFPGDVSQLTHEADGLLFLSLISGRNPDYLIGQHVKAVSKLNGHQMEVIPTGYLLIENGKETAVERVTGTKPLPRQDFQTIIDTAVAGELLGLKMIYLEAGSGAQTAVDTTLITRVRKAISIPLIVGGGFRDKAQIIAAYEAGANMVVVGTAIEKDPDFLNDLKKQ